MSWREAPRPTWLVPTSDELTNDFVRVVSNVDTVTKVGPFLFVNAGILPFLLVGGAVVAFVRALASLNVPLIVVTSVFLALVTLMFLDRADGLYLSCSAVRLRVNTRPLDIAWHDVHRFEWEPARSISGDGHLMMILADGRRFECRDFTQGGLEAKLSNITSEDLDPVAQRLTALAATSTSG